MEAVLDVYERPYGPEHPVVNRDESPKQLISQVRKTFSDSKGATYQDYEYKREGVADMYMIVEALGGHREVLVREDHTSQTYAKVVAHIVEEMYPDAKKITLVEDNLSAHKLAALYGAYEPERARSIAKKLEIVRTPKHGSWLNIAECELSVLTRQGLEKRVPDIETLKQQTKAWYSQRNCNQTKVNWQFTTKDARVKLKKLYPSI
jgi:transposase